MPTYRITNQEGEEWFVTEDNLVAAAVRARNYPGTHKRAALFDKRDQTELPLDDPSLPPASYELPDPTYRYPGGT